MSDVEREREKDFTSISIHTSIVNQIKAQIVHDSIPRLKEILAGTTENYKGLRFSVANYIELAVKEKMQRDNNALPSALQSNQSQPDGQVEALHKVGSASSNVEATTIESWSRGHCKPLPDVDGSVWPSRASYFYNAFSADPIPAQEDMIKPLIEDGYTRRQALSYYVIYLRRYQKWRQDWMRKMEGAIIG